MMPPQIKRAFQRRLLALVGVLMLAIAAGACSMSGSAAALPTATLQVAHTEPPTLAPTSAPTLTPTLPPSPTPAPSIWVAPYLPQEMQKGLKLPEGLVTASQAEGANLRLELGDKNLISRWVYALVAPFPTIADTVSSKDLLESWKGKKAGPFAGLPLLMDENTLALFSVLWGQPAAGAVKTLPAEKLLDAAWAARPAWGIVAFEALQPRWKVLEVDGQSPLRKEFNPSAYALSVPFSLDGEKLLSSNGQPLAVQAPPTNRDPGKLTTLVMTGVTALVRGTSNKMYAKGAEYPAKEIGAWLQNADITHISNEVPFDPTCPLYNPDQESLVFCTNPKYMQLLEYVNTKVVELTGDHFIDRGPDATLYTLQQYKDHGWLYYGGGANIEEGRKPVTLENNGNKLAFIGCNAKGGGYATAKENYPGAAACDYDYMENQIKQLHSEGYLVIATYQHQEYYSYKVKPEYRPDFTRMAEAGADIVQGSQAHQPQNMEFDAGGFIHYGLGNLFFDQVDLYPETKDAFIDRHIFYNGHYIGTELLTIRFVDLALSRPMTPEERAELLKVVFKASGW